MRCFRAVSASFSILCQGNGNWPSATRFGQRHFEGGGGVVIGLDARPLCAYSKSFRSTNNTKKWSDLFKRDYLRVATLGKAENSFRACPIYPSNVFLPENFGSVQVMFVPNVAETETNGPAVV
jgi:hypothetical protein